jgi:hypothetical protein
MAQAAMAPTLPSEADAVLAKETSRVLASHIRNSDPMELRIPDDPSPEGMVKLPLSAEWMLVRILEEMASGNAGTQLPVHTEWTTRSGGMLNISRPSRFIFWTRKIDYPRVGTHRRVRFEV